MSSERGIEVNKEQLRAFGYDAEAVEAMSQKTGAQLQDDYLKFMKNNHVLTGVSVETGKDIKTSGEEKPVEVNQKVLEKPVELPINTSKKYKPDYALTDEYKKMLETGESVEHLIAYKRYGSYTDQRRQEDIEHSLEVPLSECIKIRDDLLKVIEDCEEKIDNFSMQDAQKEVDRITKDFTQRSVGLFGATARARLQADYDKACDKAEMDFYTKPRNLLAVKRAEAIERYKVYENRVKLYVSVNKEAIEKRLAEARNREIDENLLALAEYMEG